MAILQKRTSTKRLPSARRLDRPPLTSAIQQAGRAQPNVVNLGGKRSDFDPMRNMTSSAVQPQPKINQRQISANKTITPTATEKPAQRAVTTKPTLTSKTTNPSTKVTTPIAKTISTKPSIASTNASPTDTTKTTSPNTVTKPTVSKTSGSKNSLTSTLVNAGTGALLGVGTKMLYDKISSNPTILNAAKSAVAGNKIPGKQSSSSNKTVTEKPTINKPPTSTEETNKQTQDDTNKPKEPEQVNGEAPVKDGQSQGEGSGTADSGPKTRSLTNNNTADATNKTDTSGDNQYVQDADGNIWMVDSSGNYTIYQYADGTSATDTSTADNTWVDPDTGEVWNLASDGTWTMEGDTTTADNTDYNNIDNTFANYTDYSSTDYTEAKRGGLITMMKNGGVPHFADGNLVDETGYAINPETGDLYTPLGTVGGEQINAEPVANVDLTGDSMNGVPVNWSDNGDGTASYWDGDQYVTVDSNTGEELYRTGQNGEVISGQDNYDKQQQYKDYMARYKSGNNLLTKGAVGGSNNVDGGDSNKISSGLLDKITGALGTTAGAAGAGALLATLLGTDFGGSSSQNQGIDMSKVGVINPRTTDFGIGPTRYVGYEDYGVAPDQEYTPNEELLHNLNAPGYNPVNEGDYGYADETELADNADEENAEVPQMASGGLSAMAPQPSQTHYTFGKPADVYANLGLRQAPVAEPVDQPRPVEPLQGQQQPQGQQPPQGQAPTGMPMGLQKPPLQQMGAPTAMPPQPPAGIPKGVPPAGAMRRGGLPHVSNVPQVDGRFDFRQGSAVHGEGDGQSDDIPAMLADGEYVIDAETVAQIGNGSTKAGAHALDKFRENIRAHKRSAPLNKIPPKTKALTSYLKGAK